MPPRKKKNAEASSGDLDAMFDAICDEAKQHYGEGNVFTGDESERNIVGIHLPALCLRYLFQSNVLPLGRMIQIVGQEGSCKSSFLYELFRWFNLNKGKNFLMEAETKDSPVLRQSILEYNEKAVLCKSCDNLEDWQDGLLHFIDRLKHSMTGTKTNPGIGKIMPACFAVDSLMGKACRDTIEKVLKEGYSSRQFPQEALVISSFMKVIPQQIAGWPFLIAGINHLKPAQSPDGRPQNNVPGGKSLKFQETYEIEMSRVKDIKKVDISGITIKLLTRKNSLGMSRLSITVNMLWWKDEDSGYRQVTIFDWPEASIETLLSFEGSRATKLQNVCPLHVVDRSKKLLWSEVLDIPRDNPVSFHEAGKILETKLDVLKELHRLLGVYEFKVFKPGIPYEDQLSADNQTEVEEE